MRDNHAETDYKWNIIEPPGGGHHFLTHEFINFGPGGTMSRWCQPPPIVEFRVNSQPLIFIFRVLILEFIKWQTTSFIKWQTTWFKKTMTRINLNVLKKYFVQLYQFPFSSKSLLFGYISRIFNTASRLYTLTYKINGKV